MKRFMALMVTVVLIAAMVAGCGGGGSKEPAGKEPAGKFRVALVMPGPVNDAGWNATAYGGVSAAQKKLDFDFQYTENVSQSDAEEVLRGYAQQGFNLVIAHGYQFGDAVLKVAKEFPKVMFITTSSNVHQAPPNAASAIADYNEEGFLMGVMAALITKTNKVGSIGGEHMASIEGQLANFEKGVKYINPSVEVKNVWTGSFSDIAKAKETAIALIEDGCDVMTASANQAGVGVIQACQQKGKIYLGLNSDQNPAGPDVVLTSGVGDWGVAFEVLIKKAMDGQLEPKHYLLGAKDGAVYPAPYHGLESKIPPEAKQKFEEVFQQMKDGKLDIYSVK
ncbi:MAG TPA: BMP family ABC transporter substrate-binding protein [Firmicutes bacterium]|nr:BMP family ABC transporter substrate-binding protein [Bacillota bacterium]